MNGFYHIKVVHEVFDKHLTPAGVDRVIRYNFNVDFYGCTGWMLLLKRVYPLYPLARHWYDKHDHIDQMDSAEIVETWRGYVDRINATIDDAAFPPSKPDRIFHTLGRASHALTDVYSHTCIAQLIYDYFSGDAVGKAAFGAASKALPDFLIDDGPTLSQLLGDAEYAPFRKNWLPKLFAFQCLPDTGPNSHCERGIDGPNSKGVMDDAYPRLWNTAYALAVRDVSLVIGAYFTRLKAENPAKFDVVTGFRRDAGLGPAGEGPCFRRARFWARLVGGWE